MSPFPTHQPWEASDPLPVMRRELKLLLIEVNMLRVEVEQLRVMRRDGRVVDDDGVIRSATDRDRLIHQFMWFARNDELWHAADFNRRGECDK